MEQTVDFQFAQTELMMNEISSGIECLVCVSVSDLTWGAFQKSELAAGLWPDQSFWQWSGLFPRAFAEKPPPSCILFRIWQMYWRVLMEWSGRPVLTNGKHPEISCLRRVIAIPGIKKKTWIPACPLGNQLSHFACRGHFLFVLVKNFVREWFSWTLAHLPLP